MAEPVPRRGAGLPHLRQIDGLRAFAVAAIVRSQVDGSWLPGGFLGVLGGRLPGE